ncbi:B-cell scaffold protein with ankyrin repeats-like [Pholidichthys leucotaenia]
MSLIAEDLLIIYETETEQWSTYLKSVFTGPISESAICCFDISTVSRRREDFLRLANYTCKLLILSKGLLEGLCKMQRFFLARVLSPAAHVVILLCGVESLTPLLEVVPLNGEECLQISSEQDVSEYQSTVIDIVRKGVSVSASIVHLPNKSSISEQKTEQRRMSRGICASCNITVIPSRVPCGSSMEVFILLKSEAAGCDAEVEFTGETQVLRVKPVRWNEHILCINAPDFPPGNVRMTIFNGGTPLNNTQLQYYSNMEEITCLLSTVADPVDFMCQALQAPSVEKLDQKLSSMLLESLPTGGFQGLQSENSPERVESHHADVPSFLHFAAQYGFKSVSSLLLQCPGAQRALHTANRLGQTPTEIAKSRGHMELHMLLKETLTMFNLGEGSGDGSVYELMGNADVQKTAQAEDREGDDEDFYALLGVNNDSDTILTSAKAAAIVNRPPAPTPRPESTQVKHSETSYISQVFQKKKTQGDADPYSLPTKQCRGQDGSTSSTYDTFVPKHIDSHQNLTELQQKKKLSPLKARIIRNTEHNDVYDKINIIHHMPSAAVNGNRRRSQPVESEFYSKPIKGQKSTFFRRADKH